MSQDEPAIRILRYDPEAPRIFEELARLIAGILPFAVRVEHIGSTAVPGLGGKGIIDCLVVAEPGRADEVCSLLHAGGFDHGTGRRPAEDRWYASGDFRGASGESRHVHIHITYADSRCEHEHLAFRDYLRAHPEESQEYFRLKHKWREQAKGDRVLFTELKTPYVTAVVKKARGQTDA